MGNRWAPYIIGAMISAVSITLIFGAIVPAFHEIPTASTGLNALGHLTLVVHNPDGSTVYRQSDNFVMADFVNDIDNAFFVDGTLPATYGAFTFLALCTTGTLQSATACAAELTSTGREDGTAGVGVGSTAMPGGGGSASRTFANSFTIDPLDDNTSVSELAIFDKATVGNMFSVASFTAFTAQSGGVVSATYTISITG